MATTPKPLLYRPPPRWQWWAAFGGAVAIHLTAVALAQKHEAPVEVPPDIPTAVVEATLQATEEPTPPPEDIPLPEPPPPPEIKPEYVEETTPPPKKPTAQKFGSVSSASMTQSIGNPILDNAAVSAFRQWRFKAGSVSKVKIPITFTMTGASY